MSFVLLHGAGLGKWIWDRAIRHLDGDVRAIDLPGRTNPGAVTLEQCVEHVVREVQSMKSKPMVVGHSFSGMIALAAASRVPQFIASVALIAAPVPTSGEAFTTLMPLPMRLFMKVLLKRAKNGIAIPASQVKKGYCNDLDEETTAFVLEKMTREAPRIYLDPIEWNVPPSVPRMFVKLRDDTSVSAKQQEVMIQRTGATKTASLSTGHLPMLAKPKELAVILNGWMK